MKLAALICASATYFFIHNEVDKKEKKAIDPSYKLIKLTAKNLPVKVRIASDAAEGYKILLDKVTASPDRIIVVGPETLLEEAFSAETALIDVSDATQTVKRTFPVENVAGIHLAGDPYIVEVTIPIEKAPEPA